MKKVIEFIKELRKKPYGKGVIFFGFYLIFFIVIFIALSVGGNKDIENTDNSNTNGINVFVEEYNYSFEYKVVLDNNTYLYVGKKDNNRFNYTYNGKEYYNIEDKSYIKEDDKELDNQIKYYKLFDESIIKELVNTAYIDSTTTYNSGDIGYSLLLSSNKLNKVIDDKDTDIDEVPNTIKIIMDSEKNIKEISYNLDNYCKINDSCSSLNITINYKDFSKIS